ncbi:carbohydrate kinase family protein [Candidatus Gracilibacteria bacterium]|nr:carbohydrate kinase family protein [Candidatus Gracilibacteria bacterium]
MNKPKYDILTFGSITLDVFLTPDFSNVKIQKKGYRDWFSFPVGEKIKIQEVRKFCGGGSANTSVGFAKLGLKSAIFGIIGDDEEGHLIRKKLKKNKVDTSFLIEEKNGVSASSIILNDPQGRRTVFHDRRNKKNFSRNTLKKSPSSKAIYISHLYDNSQDLLFEISSWKKRTKGLVAWNPGKTQFIAGFKKFKDVFPAIDLLILNTEEAELFTKIKARKLKLSKAKEAQIGHKVTTGKSYLADSIFDVRRIAQKFIQAGVGTIIITDGKQGAQLFAKDRHLFCPAPKVPIVSTLGAGDAFSVGIVTAKLLNKSLEEQIIWGSLNSGAVIQKFGAQEGQLSWREIKKTVK